MVTAGIFVRIATTGVGPFEAAELEAEELVFVVTGVPTYGTGGVPNALDEVERLMPNAGDAALIAL